MADGISYQHPGVYIQELPGVPTVQGASTSIPVFIGATEKLAAQDRNVPRKVVGWADYQAKYGSYVWGAYVAPAVYEFFAEGGAVCYVIGVAPSVKPTLASASVDDVVGTFKFIAASAGDWPNILSIAIVDAGPTPPEGQASNYFNVNVVVTTDALATASQTIWTRLLNAYVKNNSIAATPLGQAGNAKDGYILESFGAFTALSLSSPSSNGPCPLQTQINAKSMFVRVFAVPNPPKTPKGPRTGTLSLLQGGTSIKFNSSIYNNALSALASIPDASLVATPDAAVVDMTTQMTNTSDLRGVITSVMTACAKLPNLFYLIDAPYVDQPADTTNIVNFVSGGSSNSPLGYDNAAIYYPWPLVLNPITGTNVPIPPSGPVLGRYASTDLNAGVHVSPAGVVNGLIPTAAALTGGLTDSDQDQLNPHGINAIRPIRGYGIAIYGARTLAVGTQWQYIAVRRFVTFVEQSLKTSLEWVVFQPNSELLWATVVREITAFLTLLWHQGALFGSTAEEAFFVTCDNTNNPPSLRAQGVLNVDVGLAVLYPAEFVVIRIAQMTSTAGSGS